MPGGSGDLPDGRSLFRVEDLAAEQPDAVFAAGATRATCEAFREGQVDGGECSLRSLDHVSSLPLKISLK